MVEGDGWQGVTSVTPVEVNYYSCACVADSETAVDDHLLYFINAGGSFFKLYERGGDKGSSR